MDKKLINRTINKLNESDTFYIMHHEIPFVEEVNADKSKKAMIAMWSMPMFKKHGDSAIMLSGEANEMIAAGYTDWYKYKKSKGGKSINTNTWVSFVFNIVLGVLMAYFAWDANRISSESIDTKKELEKTTESLQEYREDTQSTIDSLSSVIDSLSRP